MFRSFILSEVFSSRWNGYSAIDSEDFVSWKDFMFLYTEIYPAFSTLVLVYPNQESVQWEVGTASGDAPELLRAGRFGMYAEATGTFTEQFCLVNLLDWTPLVVSICRCNGSSSAGWRYDVILGYVRAPSLVSREPQVCVRDSDFLHTGCCSQPVADCVILCTVRVLDRHNQHDDGPCRIADQEAMVT